MNKINNSKLYEFLIIVLLYFTVFQDFALGILLQLTNQVGIVKILFFSKDILMILLFIWGLIKKKIPIYSWIILIFYFVLIIFESIVSFTNGMSLFNIMSAIRTWLILPCFLVIGYAIRNKIYFYKKLRYFLTSFMIFVCIFGLIDFIVDEYITSTMPFWTDFVGLGRLMIDIKGVAEDGLILGLPGNFYGQYGGAFFSQKRLVSFWGGPLTSGYVLAIPCIWYFIKSFNIFTRKFNRHTFIRFILVFIALMATYTRALILQVILICAIWGFFNVKTIRRFILCLIPLILVVVVAKLDTLIAYVFDGSTEEHIRQFITSFKQVSLFGSGMGSFGVKSEIGTESAYISSLGQMGIFGFIIYVFLQLFPLVLIKRKMKQTRLVMRQTHDLKLKPIYDLLLVTFLVGIAMSITGIISEQLLAFTTIVPYYLMVAYSLSITYGKDKLITY